MDKEEKRVRSWGEEHGGTIFGVGIFVLLGTLVVVMRLCGGS